MIISVCTQGNNSSDDMNNDDDDDIGGEGGGIESSITSVIRTVRPPSLSLDADSQNYDDDDDDVVVKLVRSSSSSRQDSPSSSSSSSSISTPSSSTATVGSQNQTQNENESQQQQQDIDNVTCSKYSAIIIDDDILSLPPLPEPKHGIMKEESSRGICLVLTVIVLLPILVHYIALTVILPSDSDLDYPTMLPGKIIFLILTYLEIALGLIGLCGILYVDPCVIHRSKETCFPIPIQVESYIIEYQQYNKYYEQEQQLLLQQQQHQQQHQQETAIGVVNYERLLRPPPTITTHDRRLSLQPPLALRPPRPPKESYIKGNNDIDTNNDNNDVYCTKCLVWRRRGSRSNNNNNSTSTSTIHYFHCAICQRCCAYHDHHCGVFGRCISGNIKSYWNWNFGRTTTTTTGTANSTSSTGNIIYFILLIFVGACTSITIFSSFIYAFAIRYGKENLKFVIPIGLIICMAFISCCCFSGNYGPMNIICWPIGRLCRLIIKLINRIIF